MLNRRFSALCEALCECPQTNSFLAPFLFVCDSFYLTHLFSYSLQAYLSLYIPFFYINTVCKYTLHLQGHETKPRVLIIIKSILVFFSLLASFFSFIRESLADVIGLSFFLFFFFYLQLLFKYILKFQFSLLLSQPRVFAIPCPKSLGW